MTIVIPDATELLKQLRRRELSAVEAAHAAIERIELLNPTINAVVTTTFDEALVSAQRADHLAASGNWKGALHGVPILIKDLVDFRTGVRNTFGCRATADFVPNFTMAHIGRLEDAGATLLGKTNTPEFGHKAITDNRLLGPTCCPFDPSRNAGGSSGGSAAAVAAGMVPLAQGSDAGGSIRIPAAWCGVMGFKPTYGRIPNTGSANLFGLHSPFVHNGPLTRSVRDAALMAQVMSGPHPDDPFSLPDDDMDLLAALTRDAGQYRLAYSSDLGVFAVEPAVAETVEGCVQALRNAGMQIDDVPLKLPLGQDELAQLWLRQMGVVYLDMFDTMARTGRDLLVEFADEIPLAVHRMVEEARQRTALGVRLDDRLRTDIWRTVQELFVGHDLLLTPTVGALPTPNSADGNSLGPTHVDGRAVEPCIGWCLTHPFNFTGHPAASVPAGLSRHGLPVGLQVIGRRFGDESVIAVSRRIEEVRPWQGDLAGATERLERKVKGQ